MNARPGKQATTDPHPSALPGTGRLVVGFSGGADSAALAHLIANAQIERKIICVHVNHGLDAGSSRRAQHAASIAAQLNLEFVLENIEIDKRGNQEAAARSARYRALQKHLGSDGCLLTAHHADDQVETVLFRLLRGAGPRGLSGIPRLRPCDGGWVARPLLDWSRAALQAYCRSHRIDWIEDPSNASMSADRNFLRHAVLPVLRDRWPGLDTGVLQTAALAGQAAESIEARLKIRLAENSGNSQTLEFTGLRDLNRFELGEVIRLWCRQQCIPTPPGASMEEFLDQVKKAPKDALPRLQWQHHVLIYWDQKLWMDVHQAAPHYSFEWQTGQALELPEGIGSLELIGDQGTDQLLLGVRSGQPGDRVCLEQSGSKKRVKELLRCAGVPPWQRSRWPRIFSGSTLLAIGDQWIDHDFAAQMKQRHLRLKWHRIETSAISTPESQRENHESEKNIQSA